MKKSMYFLLFLSSIFAIYYIIDSKKYEQLRLNEIEFNDRKNSAMTSKSEISDISSNFIRGCSISIDGLDQKYLSVVVNFNLEYKYSVYALENSYDLMLNGKKIFSKRPFKCDSPIIVGGEIVEYQTIIKNIKYGRLEEDDQIEIIWFPSNSELHVKAIKAKGKAE